MCTEETSQSADVVTGGNYEEPCWSEEEEEKEQRGDCWGGAEINTGNTNS